jgi:alkylation response protein AidB-like acyl-CoA dehydrogenase
MPTTHLRAADGARENLARWRDAVGSNFYRSDSHLQSLLTHYGRRAVADELDAFGARCAGDLDELARESNRVEHLPRLRRYDPAGRRTESVVFHPSYHDIGRAAYATRAMSRYATPGRELETLAFVYLLAHNGEAGHTCPLACTAGLIKILQRSGDAPAAWLDRLLDPDYDTHFHGAQFLTEIQGGSDVGANGVTASQDAHGTWRISGEKWFCSVIDANLFLVTARPEGERDGTRGLQGFAVPRTLADGTTNAFTIRRLKDKLGTRSMASAEIDLNGAVAHPVGPFRNIVETVLNTSRLYNAIVSAGMMQRAWLEASAFAQTRMAFTRPIAAFPSVARILARLRTEAYAARATSFLLAHQFDRIAVGDATDGDVAAVRMLVNLNKLWTSIAGTTAIRDAIEVLGGNGAIEEFSVLPRLLRDAIVCEAWEGGHNVLCAQALRDSRRQQLHIPMFDMLQELGGDDRLAVVRARWQRVIEAPEQVGDAHIRDVVDELRPIAQAIALRSQASEAHGDPLAAIAADHLLAITRPSYDPLEDPTLMDRVAALGTAR